MAQVVLLAWREDESKSFSFCKGVQEEEALGVLQLPEPSQWGRGSPSLHELKARIAANLQNQAYSGAAGDGCLVHVQRADGLLVPVANDAMLQKALASWQQVPHAAGADTPTLSHKLYVSLPMQQAGTPGTDASTPGASMLSGAHAPSPPQASPSVPASSNQTVSAHGQLSMHQISTAETHVNEFGHLPALSTLRTGPRNPDPKDELAAHAAAGAASTYSSTPNTPFSQLSMASRTQDNMPWEAAGGHGQSFLDLHGMQAPSSLQAGPARTPTHNPMHGSMGGAHSGRLLSRLAPQPPSQGLSLAEATYQRLAGSGGFSGNANAATLNLSLGGNGNMGHAVHAGNLAHAASGHELQFGDHSADMQQAQQQAMHAAHRHLQQQAMQQSSSPVSSRSQGGYAHPGPGGPLLNALSSPRHPSVITTGTAMAQAGVARHLSSHNAQSGNLSPRAMGPQMQDADLLGDQPRGLADGGLAMRPLETSDPGAVLLSRGTAAMASQQGSATRRAVTTGGGTPKAMPLGTSPLPSMPSVGGASSLADGELHSLAADMVSGDDDVGRATPKKGGGRGGGRTGRGGIAGRVIKSRESSTKYADGRKKDEQHHLASMAVMSEACNNMFGSLSHLVQVDDYKHIRCLACTPQCVVKTYSAYHTACIRKHFLRHHHNLLTSSDVDLSNFKEYKEKMNKSKHGNNGDADGDGGFDHSLHSTPSVSRSLIGTFGGAADLAGSPDGTPRSRPQRRAYRATIDVPSASWDHAANLGGLGNGVTTGLRPGATSMGGLGGDAFSGSTSVGGTSSPHANFFPASASFAAGALRAPVRHIVTHHPGADNEMSHLGSPFLHMGTDVHMKQQGLDASNAAMQGAWTTPGMAIPVPPVPPGHHQALHSNLNSNMNAAPPITWAGPPSHQGQVQLQQRRQGNDMSMAGRLGVGWNPNTTHLTAAAAASALMSSVTTGAKTGPLLQQSQQLLKAGRTMETHLPAQWDSMDTAPSGADRFMNMGMHGATDALRMQQQQQQVRGSPARSLGGAGDQQMFQAGGNGANNTDSQMHLERTLANSMQHLQHLMHMQNMQAMRSSGGGAQQRMPSLHALQQHSHGGSAVHEMATSQHSLPVPQSQLYDMDVRHGLNTANKSGMHASVLQQGTTPSMRAQQPSPYNSMEQQGMAAFLSNYKKDPDSSSIQPHLSYGSSADAPLISRDSNGLLASLNMDPPMVPGSPLHFQSAGMQPATNAAHPYLPSQALQAGAVGMQGITDMQMSAVPEVRMAAQPLGGGQEPTRRTAGGAYALGSKRPANTAISSCSIQEAAGQDGGNDDDDDDGFGFASDGLQNYSYDQYLSRQGSELDVAITPPTVEEGTQELQL